jgi:hypothetical protein
MGQNGSLEESNQRINSHFLLMESHGLSPVLGMRRLALVAHVPPSHQVLSHILSTPPWKRLLRKRGHRMFREIYGSQGAQEQINWHILTMVLAGLALLLETQYLHQVTHAEHSPGMEHDGSLEVMEQIASRILPME